MCIEDVVYLLIFLVLIVILLFKQNVKIGFLNGWADRKPEEGFP